MDTDKHGHTEETRDLHSKLLGKSHRDLLEVKVNNRMETMLYSYQKTCPQKQQFTLYKSTMQQFALYKMTVKTTNNTEEPTP